MDRLSVSLVNPHPESLSFVEMGFEAWGAVFEEGGDALVDPNAGRAVKWLEDLGWVEA